MPRQRRWCTVWPVACRSSADGGACSRLQPACVAAIPRARRAVVMTCRVLWVPWYVFYRTWHGPVLCFFALVPYMGRGTPTAVLVRIYDQHPCFPAEVSVYPITLGAKITNPAINSESISPAKQRGGYVPGTRYHAWP